MFHAKRLSIYLNDHLAAATGGAELAKRTAGSNADSPQYGPVLERAREEVEADRETLLDVMRRLDVGRDAVKVGAGWMAEKVGRLKLNDQLTGYSPLSRLVEIEGLILIVSGNEALWSTLAELASDDPRLDGVDLRGAAQRAGALRSALAELRTLAASEALAGA